MGCRTHTSKRVDIGSKGWIGTTAYKFFSLYSFVKTGHKGCADGVAHCRDGWNTAAWWIHTQYWECCLEAPRCILSTHVLNLQDTPWLHQRWGVGPQIVLLCRGTCRNQPSVLNMIGVRNKRAALSDRHWSCPEWLLQALLIGMEQYF